MLKHLKPQGATPIKIIPYWTQIRCLKLPLSPRWWSVLHPNLLGQITIRSHLYIMFPIESNLPCKTRVNPPKIEWLSPVFFFGQTHTWKTHMGLFKNKVPHSIQRLIIIFSMKICMFGVQKVISRHPHLFWILLGRSSHLLIPFID